MAAILGRLLVLDINRNGRDQPRLFEEITKKGPPTLLKRNRHLCKYANYVSVWCSMDWHSPWRLDAICVLIQRGFDILSHLDRSKRWLYLAGDW